MLLDSFLRLMTHANIDELNNDEKYFFNTWLQSQLSIIDRKSFNLFQLIFEKSLITFMIQQKSSRTNAIFMYVLSTFTLLVELYYDCEGDNQTSNIASENQKIRHLQLLDRLDKLIIYQVYFYRINMPLNNSLPKEQVASLLTLVQFIASLPYQTLQPTHLQKVALNY